jgi:hypothetical protein
MVLITPFAWALRSARFFFSNRDERWPRSQPSARNPVASADYAACKVSNGAEAPDTPKAGAKKPVKPSPALAPSTNGANHPGSTRDGQPANDTTKSAQAAPTIEALLAVLRSLDSAPQQTASVRLPRWRP